MRLIPITAIALLLGLGACVSSSNPQPPAPTVVVPPGSQIVR